MIFSLLSLSCTLIRFSMSIQAFYFSFELLSGFTVPWISSRSCKGRQPFGYLVMGSSGLEPPTSRLSGARSNLLSYEPVLKSLVIFVRQPTDLRLVTLLYCFSFHFRLSGLPDWRWWDSNPWPPACRAGALPTELHPRFKGAVTSFNKTHSKLNNKLDSPVHT